MLIVIAGFTHKCFENRFGFCLTSDHVLDVSSALFVSEGLPDYTRSDNGSESAANALKDWLLAWRGDVVH